MTFQHYQLPNAFPLLLQCCLERAEDEHSFKMPVACLDLADLLSDDIAPSLMACAIIACAGSSPGLSRAWEDIEALLVELGWQAEATG